MNRFSRYTGHPILGRGDLVEALGSGDKNILHAVADQLGLQYRIQLKVPSGSGTGVGHVGSSTSKVDSTGYPQQIEDVAFWVLVGHSTLKPLPKMPEGPEYIRWTDQRERPLDPPEYRALASWSYVGSILRRDLTSLRWSGTLDMVKLIAKFAQRQVITTLPRKSKRRWGSRFQIINDASFRLSPFQHDHKLVIDELSRLIPNEKLEIAVGDSPFSLSRSSLSEQLELEYRPYELPAPGSHVLVLSDLGGLDRSAGAWRVWMQWGRMIVERGCRLQALVPCPESRIADPLRQVYSIQTWQRPTPTLMDEAQREELVRRLLVLASPALRVEPGLLRELRLLIPDAVDASLEADFWNHEWLSSNHPAAATIDYRKVNDVLRPQFERLAPDLRQKVLNCIRHWRVSIQGSPEIWFEEVLALSPQSRELLPKLDLDDAYACMRRIERLRSEESFDRSAYEAFMYRLTQRAGAAALNDATVGRILRNAKRELHPNARGVATGTDPREIPGGQLREYRVQVFDKEVIVSPKVGPVNGAQGQPCAVSIRSSNQHFTVGVGQATTENSFWKSGKKPEFVSAFGRDHCGAWIEFEVPRRNNQGVVTQRMRWIRAGTFMMGSPEDEPERFDDELLHQVTLRHGFWLADTACTQAMWQAVMGENPSHFNGDDRPVEQVSYDDAIRFCAWLSKHIPGLQAQLPTDAQWEYACRAGTQTPFSFGSTITTDQANFNGNYPYADATKGIYREETVAVKDLPANAWGVYQMHGNVWEWCSDWYSEKLLGSQVDPAGPGSGSLRVFRGGGWGSFARGVRSACRGRGDPGLRYRSLGFRLLSSASAEPIEMAEVPVAEQGSELFRIGAAEEFFREIAVRVDDGNPAQLPIEHSSTIRVVSNLESIELQRLTKPNWAVEYGRDAFGVYGDFEVASSKDDSTVRQRLRWIPPGSFQMGSPLIEPGRSEDEGLHPVTITSGFWMFDAPCSQRLWAAVMDENPSYFPDPERPVESVDWDRAGEFAKKLSERLSVHRDHPLANLTFALPTEAQWEYACRAGTSTAIYTGPLEIIGDANAPALDAIAWYGGNSGHQYDLDKSVDVTGYKWLSDKQFPFTHAGTRRVKQKAPNRWGLYDMLGNVWEWCSDWYTNVLEGSHMDPHGPESGSGRVMRGGCWLNVARDVRSACRNRYVPGNRNQDVGFRLLSSASLASSGPVTERVSGSRSLPPTNYTAAIAANIGGISASLTATSVPPTFSTTIAADIGPVSRDEAEENHRTK